jgi:regulator of protease activity HflC (stomatin/prohibitin superfamily)
MLIKIMCTVQAAAINVAEGKKQAKILESEAEKQQLINEAQGSAQAVVAAGEARAKSILAVAEVGRTSYRYPSGHQFSSLTRRRAQQRPSLRPARPGPRAS